MPGMGGASRDVIFTYFGVFRLFTPYRSYVRFSAFFTLKHHFEPVQSQNEAYLQILQNLITPVSPIVETLSLETAYRDHLWILMCVEN